MRAHLKIVLKPQNLVVKCSEIGKIWPCEVSSHAGHAKHAKIQTCQYANMRNMATWKNAMETCQHVNVQTCQLTTCETWQHTNVPTC